MERNDQRQDHLAIDLGAVATETKGPGPFGADTVGLERIQVGLSDD